MKNILLINATFDQPDFVEDLVEKLADKHNDLGYSHALVPADLTPVEISSTETFASGTMALGHADEIINMPFITRFLFTCIKESKGTYKLEWSSSLS